MRFTSSTMAAAIKLPMTPQKMASTIYSLLSGPKVFGPRYNRGLLVWNRGKRIGIIPYFSTKGKEVDGVATLNVGGGTGFLTWVISDLQTDFTATTYSCAGITDEAFEDGCTVLPGATVASVKAGIVGTTSVSGTVSCPPGYYTFYGFAQGKDGRYWNAGEASVEVFEPRPSYWSWTEGLIDIPKESNLQSGDDIPPFLSASGWDQFTGNINDVTQYVSGGEFNTVQFTPGGSGTTVLTHDMVNEAIRQINRIVLPEEHSKIQLTVSGTPISATLLNDLANALNSVY